MDEEEDQQKMADLVKELVLRLISQNPNPNSHSPSPNPNSPQFQHSLRYAHRILSSRLTPSVTPDAAAMADSIKCCLATQGGSASVFLFGLVYGSIKLKFLKAKARSHKKAKAKPHH